MDIKIDGLKYEIMEAALAQARDGRLYPWKINRNFLKEDVKTYSKIITRRIPNSFIGALIGPGGKVIQELQKKTTGTTIVINEDPITEEGVIEILGTDPAGIEAVLAKIKSITFKPQMNVAYEVKVIKMLDFGAVVEYLKLQEMKYYFTYLNLHGNVQKMFLTL
jgi:polyribonucleotide nucleotidyltransferase